jgi:hypothetical protein
MILLASTAAKAIEQPILITVSELKTFEKTNHLHGFAAQLFVLGLIVQTNKKDIYVFNDVALSKISDESLIRVISNMVSWLTDDKVQIESKDWKNMTPTTQDYRY